MSSPYKLQYRVLRPSPICATLRVVDSVFDDYGLAIKRAGDMLAEYKGAEIQLVLIGPNDLVTACKHEDFVLFSRTILEMAFASEDQ